MSPEQCRGAGEVDHRTDVYAMGCMLFEMLTGSPPFEGAHPFEVIGKHQFVAPPTVRSLRHDVSPELEALVMRCLAKQPDQRYQTMTELITALKSCSLHAGSANEALPPEIGLGPPALPMGGPPTALLRPRKLPEREPPERELVDREPLDYALRPEREPPARKLAGREPPARKLAGRELPEWKLAGLEPPAREPPERESVEQKPEEREHVAVVVPAGERQPDDPVECEPVVREVGSRSEVATPQFRTRKRGIFFGIVGGGVAAVVAVVAVVSARPADVVRPPSDTAGSSDAAPATVPPAASAVTTVTQDAAQIATIQDADSGTSTQLAKANKTGSLDAAPAAVPPDAPAVTTVTQDAAQTATIQDADSGTSAQLTKAQKALDQEHWQGALDATKDILTHEPANAEAQKIAIRAKWELDNQQHYNDMNKQLKKRDYNSAASWYRKIERKSAYFARAQQDIIPAIHNYARWLAHEHWCALLDDLVKIVDRDEVISKAYVANLRCQDLDGAR